SDLRWVMPCGRRMQPMLCVLGISMIETLFLLISGLLGGAVNSLAGGGSFIVFPALLFVGIPPVIANASNTYAALPGYASGVVGYWHAMARYKDKLVLYGIMAAVFG